MEFLKAEYRRLVQLFCEKYNQILGQDIFNKANNRTSEKEKEEMQRKNKKSENK